MKSQQLQQPNTIINTDEITQCRELIWDYYRTHKRDFAWRQTTDPYAIVVSEIMLQQTQTQRVVHKYAQFLEALPNFAALAAASQKEVLSLWSGLGYNRRGLALQAVAKRVISDFNGLLPADPATLQTFSGIGPNTAGSICAFAFNLPTVFIETNIRTIIIHHFFTGHSAVKDRDIMPIVAALVDQDNPREWYYAMMDYGVMLKKTVPNPSRKSATHSRQSKFEGSERQIRGAIIRLLTEYPRLTEAELTDLIGREPERVHKNVTDLCREGLVFQQYGYYFL